MEYLTVGEVAQRSGLPVSTIHFWESKGLIRSLRSDGNQRRFARPELRRIAVIKIGQRAGIPLSEIRDVLDTLPADRAVSAKSWAALSRRWKGSLDDRIARLTALRDQLGQCIGCGCLSLNKCWLRNANDKLATEGPGPRLLNFDE
ncbi:MAG: redox-sensitive transcriptional activator SoxR [Candidatus Eremiobacteraeota bacterium]|nr:redox-sensitive transcriptional activator SoxR [Candidatus Eremiobacteraeota bacterium]MBV9055091.1 redox-sensitive transcriptional activator SoxR [Candidatus Eremiobacteraeota bacterium]MBV9698839.1 redox-sensitive transcriptional activator SoxR [Candidatus Eremiobacteraeota bacterium]